MLLGLSDKTKITLFSKLSHFYFDLRPPGQDRGAKTRPQGQLECANPRGVARGDGHADLELTDTLCNYVHLGSKFLLVQDYVFEFNRNVILNELLVITSFYRTRDVRRGSVSPLPSRSIENS